MPIQATRPSATQPFPAGMTAAPVGCVIACASVQRLHPRQHPALRQPTALWKMCRATEACTIRSSIDADPLGTKDQQESGTHPCNGRSGE